MNVYIALWIIVLLFSFLEINCSCFVLGKYRISVKKLSFIVIYLYVLFLGICRDEMLGVDMWNYRNNFFYAGERSISELLYSKSFDKGFYLLAKLIYHVSPDFWVFKSIIYFLTFSLLSYVIYRYSIYPAVSFLGYFGFTSLAMMFCLLRQALAISLVFCSIGFIRERKPIKFIFLVLLASTMHSTAIAFLLVYPFATGLIYKILMRFKWLILFLAILFGNYVLPSLYQYYRIDYSERAISGEGGVRLLIYFVLIVGIGYLTRKENDPELKMEYHIMFLAIPIQIIALFFSLFTRMAGYLIIMMTLVVPRALTMKALKPMNNFFLTGYSFVCSILFFYSINSANIVPYMSIWK